MIRLLATWLALMLLLGSQVLAARVHHGGVAWVIAPVMVGLVALAFMHAARAPALARIFAAAGLFWVAILLTLGTVDYAARQEYRTPVQALP